MPADNFYGDFGLVSRVKSVHGDDIWTGQRECGRISLSKNIAYEKYKSWTKRNVWSNKLENAVLITRAAERYRRALYLKLPVLALKVEI